ncbi:MAG: sugar phosphate nucleotidyltransferase [Patescibacteria group bacterium]
MKVVVPMAGKGSRFSDAAHLNSEYKKPKPLISIKGKPMIVWAIESLKKFNPKPQDLIFICRQDHEDDFQISRSLKDLFGDQIKIVLIAQITKGAAETVLKAKEYISSDEDIIVSDSDHYFDGSFLYNKVSGKDSETEGVIPVFKPPDKDPKWSFSLVEKGDTVTAVGEKDKELAAKGAYANIGGYYFTHGNVFVKEVEGAILENDLTGDEGKKEFYVAPIYQRLISKGKKIIAAITPNVWGLGTPKDVEYFETNFK